MGALRIPEGRRCASILTDFISRNAVDEVLLKIHPREEIDSYEEILAGWRAAGAATIVADRTQIFSASECLHVAHLSTLALDLLAEGQRVALFKLNFPQDAENTLGALAVALAFDSVEDLERIASEPEELYWRRVFGALENLDSFAKPIANIPGI